MLCIGLCAPANGYAGNARAPSAVKVERSPIVSPHRRIESKDHEPVLKRKHSNTRSPSPLAAAGATLVPAAPFNEPHDTQLLTIAVPTKTRTFAISDEEKLLEFYEHCFTGMQGMASKRIAREWIKGISPKKQAIYPYQSSKHKKPQWWPPTDVCPFTEPDHLKKDGKYCTVVAMSHVDHFTQNDCNWSSTYYDFGLVQKNSKYGTTESVNHISLISLEVGLNF